MPDENEMCIRDRLWAGAPHFFLDSMSYSDCAKVRHEVESRGMQVKILTPENCTYQYQFAAQEPELYEKSFAYFANALKACLLYTSEGKISNESPVGKALIGARKGDTVSVEMPAGVMEYKILGIERNI